MTTLAAARKELGNCGFLRFVKGRPEWLHQGGQFLHVGRHPGRTLGHHVETSRQFGFTHVLALAAHATHLGHGLADMRFDRGKKRLLLRCQFQFGLDTGQAFFKPFGHALGALFHALAISRTSTAPARILSNGKARAKNDGRGSDKYGNTFHG